MKADKESPLFLFEFFTTNQFYKQLKQVVMLQRKQTIAAPAKPCGAMESGNHSKNGASLKSLMSKGNIVFKSFLVVSILATVILHSCNKSEKHDDENGYISKEEIIGTWICEDESFSLTFKSNGIYIHKEGTSSKGGAYDFASPELTLYEADGNVSDRYRVVSVSATILELKSLDSYGYHWIFKKGSSEDEDDTNPPLPPTGLTAKVEGNKIRVSWDPVEYADCYQVICKYNEYTSYENDIQECYFIYTPQKEETLYSFEVQAIRNTPYEMRSYYSKVSCYYSRSGGGGSETGLYMGIIGFNDQLDEEKIGMLTDYQIIYNTSTFTRRIKGMTKRDNTGLFYAVDNALSRLEVAILPDDLKSVSMITFTDGADNVSRVLNPQYATISDYRDAVQKRILETKIKGKEINAYSIGLGNSGDREAFRAGLEAIASKKENIKEVSDMTEVNRVFRELADQLYRKNETTTISLKTPAGYDNGTKLRYTFDVVTNAEDSKYYVEGKFNLNGKEATLQELDYKKVASSSGSTVSGTLNLADVTFTFKNFEFIEESVGLKNIQLWKCNPGSDSWILEDEFKPGDNVKPVIEKESAVIMLVLDCTTSLSDVDFQKMKDAANNFIEILTQKNE